MARVEYDGDTVGFKCPGCGNYHCLPVRNDSGERPSWVFNGNTEKPTLKPSILMKSGHYCNPHKEGGDCWCTFEKKHGRKPPFVCVICHSFVTDGKIQFLGDCTHALAGQTVDLPDVQT